MGENIQICRVGKNGLEGHHRKKNGLGLKNHWKCDFERYRACSRTRLFLWCFSESAPRKTYCYTFQLQKIKLYVGHRSKTAAFWEWPGPEQLGK